MARMTVRALNLDSSLTTETVQGLALALERVDDIHRGNCLSASVLGVSDTVADDVLQKDLEDTTSLFVDETGNTLHTTTTSKTADSRLRDTLDIITQDLAVTLGTALAESLASFSTSGHVAVSIVADGNLWVDGVLDHKVGMAGALYHIRTNPLKIF
jgi:hypothetical protein